jgi:hypothetical protein
VLVAAEFPLALAPLVPDLLSAFRAL